MLAALATPDAHSLPLGGGGSGWGGRGGAARPIGWTDARSLLQPDSGDRSAASLSVTPTPTLPLRGGGSSFRRALPICIKRLGGGGTGGGGGGGRWVGLRGPSADGWP